MKKMKKALVLLLCAVLLVAGSVMGTLAYLTAHDDVVNTFTVGDVNIKLQEYDINVQSGVKDAGTIKDDGIEDIELVPGREIQKHPFVTVKADSEPCFLFVKVENSLAAFETKVANDTVHEQMKANGWQVLAGNVYVYKNIVPTSVNPQVFDLFTSIKIDTQAQAVDGWSDIANGNGVVINAYAIQSEGFSSAEEAWAAYQAQPSNP